MQKCGVRSVARRQSASLTPWCSSIASERIHPGVSATAVAARASSSRARAHARRITEAFARS
jgi:hypothetical protein